MQIIKVAIIGAGELGHQALHYMRLMEKNNIEYTPVGWLDDSCSKGEIREGIPVIGTTNDIITLYRKHVFDACFIAIGYNHLDYKSQLIKNLKSQIPLVNIIAPQSYIDPTVSLGVNIFIYPGVIIDKGVRLHDGCLLNLGTIVSHDSEIGESTFLAPNVSIAGFSKIGNTSFLGIGTTVIDNIEICNKVKIGASSVVTRNINQTGTYYGIPAIFKHL